MEKRVYSLNLAAYIQMATGIEPDLGTEYEKQLVYCIFPECEGVSAAIREYKADKSLHDYLQAYADLRQAIKSAREG